MIFYFLFKTHFLSYFLTRTLQQCITLNTTQHSAYSTLLFQPNLFSSTFSTLLINSFLLFNISKFFYFPLTLTPLHLQVSLHQSLKNFKLQTRNSNSKLQTSTFKALTSNHQISNITTTFNLPIFSLFLPSTPTLFLLPLFFQLFPHIPCFSFYITLLIYSTSRSKHLLALKTYIEQNHRSVLALLLWLEKYTLLVPTMGTRLVRPRQRWIIADVLHHTSSLTDVGYKFVSVHFWIFCQLRIVAVSAWIKKTGVILVFSRIQHVVAFCTEPERRHGW